MTTPLKVYLLTVNNCHGEETSSEIYASQEAAQKEADRINKIEQDWADNPSNPRGKASKSFASVQERDIIA